MPDPALSAALEEAYASAPTDSVILHTLEFRHATFTTPLRVVLDHQVLTATLEADAPEDGGEAVAFVPYAFRFRLPDVSTSGMPEIEIEIDNVASEIIVSLDQAAQSSSLIEVTYRPYLSNDLTAPQMDPPLTLVLHDVEADVFAVRGRASFGDYGNRRFPGEWYDAQRFPGLLS